MYEWRMMIATFIICLVIAEATLHLVVEPSDVSYGNLWGRELPPFTLIPPVPPPRPMSDRIGHDKVLTVEGQPLTKGDLFGIHRWDNRLGYVTVERARSERGWWQTNNVGARAKHDVGREVPAGITRVLVFGDSFGAGTRVRQEETWTSVWQRTDSNLEILNFAVDGYSMGQAFLRYQEVSKMIDYSIVLVMFAPEDDLWRDVNTIRDLYSPWKLYEVMPRFILSDGQLKLIQGLYEDPPSIYAVNGRKVSEELLGHLSTYDRFYFRTKYEEPWLIGRSIIYKLAARAYFLNELYRQKRDLMNPGGEALQISRKIFEAMHEQAQQNGKQFIVVLLPTGDPRNLVQGGTFWQTWRTMVSAVCAPSLQCIDLAAGLASAPLEDLDHGADGTHYGPRASRLIAKLIGDKLLDDEASPCSTFRTETH